jgi:hypothetical protein
MKCFSLTELMTGEPIEQEPRGFSLAGKVTNFEVYGSVQHYR